MQKIIFSNPPLFTKKKEIAEKLLTLTNFKNEHEIYVNYHKTPCLFRSACKSSIHKLQSIIPKQWAIKKNPPEPIVFDLITPSEFNITNKEWENETEPECYLIKTNQYEIALQRDFIGISKNNNKFVIVCNEMIEDGFYNAMRWALPRLLISQNKAVLHSSAIVCQDNQARIFLGQSGAGKTTIAKLRGPRIVLGDDMNIISLVDNKCFVEAALLGQNSEIPSAHGYRYPVHSFYYLSQNIENSLINLSLAEAGRHLLASYANLFLEHNNTTLADDIFLLTKKIINHLPFFQLNFTKTQELWQYVK